MKEITAYTDGSCTANGNDGAGGWAYIIIDDDNNNETSNYGGEEVSTSNRMELTAILECLKSQKEKCNFTIYSDSKYCVNTVNQWMRNWQQKNWMKGDGNPVKNLDIIKEIFELCNFHTVKARWIKGHSGNHYNEIVDGLANESAKMFLPCHLLD